ncbi:hypothetical protein TNCV_1280621 [Trichonephila clavipes]|nr:hypothetical protein TNCV_1280621 [Trichonephila clavipes]
MQFHSEIRIPLGLEHNKFSIYQQPLFSAGVPKNATIVRSLLEPCNKNDPTNVIKAKGLKTIDKYSKFDFVFIYIDFSSVETFSNGDSGVFMTTSSDTTYHRVTRAGAIAFYFTSELRAIIGS